MKVTILNRMVGVCLTEKLRFEQRLVGGERVNQAAIWEGSILGKGNGLKQNLQDGHVPEVDE